MSVELETELAARLLEYMISQHGKRDGGRAEVLTRDLGAAIRATDADTIAAAKPDSHLGLLIRLLGAVQVQSGRSFAAVPTVDGVDAACSAMRELVPALGATVQTGPTPAQLCEAVRVQTPVYRMVIKEHTSSWSNENHVETGVIEAQPCACGLPREREEVVLEDGRRGRVLSVSHAGASAVVTVLLSGQVQAKEA